MSNVLTRLRLIRKYFFCCLMLSVILPCLTSLGGEMNLTELKNKIEDLIQKAEGDFAVAFINLTKDESLFINEKEIFHAASTMKTPLMMEVFKQAEEGKFNLDDSIIVKNEFKSIVDGSIYNMDIADDSGDDLYKYTGKPRTIYQLVYDMITVSSNLATNILIDFVDAKNVTRTMRTIGADDIQVLRGVEDIKAYRQGLNNTTTAYDLAVIFKAIDRCKITSQESCGQMIKILLDQKFEDKIPALLPPEVKVAHKTGWITGISHDSGIVYLPGGKKYVLVILSKNWSDDKSAAAAIQQISKLVYDYVVE